MTTCTPEQMEAARQLVADIFARPAAEIPDDMSILSEPAWDSLNHVRIILALEERRGQPLDSGSIAGLSSLEAIARALPQEGGGGGSSQP